MILPGILVLAAGKASRFGGDKMMATMPDGRPLIAHTLAPLLATAARHSMELCVVIRPGHDTLQNYLERNRVQYEVCTDAHSGMGHSLSYGVRCNQHWNGWIIALGDMPDIHQTTLEEMIRHVVSLAGPSSLICRPEIMTDNGKRPGHPVYFPHTFGYELSKITGDEGGSSIVKNNKQLLHTWLVEDEGVLRDIDTQAELDER